MATKKVNTPAQVEPKQAEAKQEQAKVYQFKSENPYLTVAYLGIQFREGKASTTSLGIAKALAKMGGVELIED